MEQLQDRDIFEWIEIGRTAAHDVARTARERAVKLAKACLSDTHQAQFHNEARMESPQKVN